MKELFTKHKYDKLREYLSHAKTAAIITHTNPDGDAIGSSLAWQRILKQYFNIESTIVTSNYLPDFLKWMKGSADIAVYMEDKSRARTAIKESDLVFCLDFNLLSRADILEKIIRESSAPRIIIDHHIAPAKDFDLYFSYHPISSTSELVYRIAKKITKSRYFDKDTAEDIYCGMMTDSGAFAHSSSYPDFFKIIANLMDCGIDKDKIHHSVFDNFSEKRMRLLGRCLSTMVVLPKYRTAYMILSKAEMKEFDFATGDTEGFVNYPLSISGIIMSIFFTEKDDHLKMSLRSQGDFSVNDLANKYFNGGGHKNAAGGKIVWKIEDVGKKLEEILKNYEKDLRNS